jgi:hypothetical protein
MRLFAGDGESNGQGAAEGQPWDRVRTRADLASLINMPDNVNVKREPEEEQGCALMDMEESDDILYLRSVRQPRDDDEEEEDDEEKAYALMDEEEEVSVVDTEGEGEDDADDEGREDEDGEDGGRDEDGNDGESTEVAGNEREPTAGAGAGPVVNAEDDDKGLERSDDRMGEEDDSDAPEEVAQDVARPVKHPDAMYKPVQSIRSGSQKPMKLKNDVPRIIIIQDTPCVCPRIFNSGNSVLLCVSLNDFKILCVVFVSRKNIFFCVSSFSILVFYGDPAQWCAITNSPTPKA